MPVFVDVKPRLDDEATGSIADEIRAAVAAGVRDALEAFSFGLSLTADEREAVAKYRNNQAAARRRAKAHIGRSMNRSES